MRLWVIFGCLSLVAAAPAIAQAQDADAGLPDSGVSDDGGYLWDGGWTELPDASIPDASVGEGGADQSSPESSESERTPTLCRRSVECAQGFECQQGRCRWTGIRHAQGGGCLGAVPAMVFAIGLIAFRRRKS